MADNPLRPDGAGGKARRLALRRAWYKKNRERINAKRKATYRADGERARLATREWYAENRERALAYHAAYRAANREKLRAYHRAHHASNPERVRNNNLRKLYGLSAAQWDSLFAFQGRMCAICSASHPGAKQWQTDHCHKTGVVRGILCAKCNRTAGNHDPEYLRAVADYVESQGVAKSADLNLRRETCAVRIPTEPATSSTRAASSTRKPARTTTRTGKSRSTAAARTK